MMHCRFLRDRHGRPVYPIGVNYWLRRTAVEMWTRWDPEGIAQDLREMRALGLNTVRFFLMTADFADAEGTKPQTVNRSRASIVTDKSISIASTWLHSLLTAVDMNLPATGIADEGDAPGLGQLHGQIGG